MAEETYLNQVCQEKFSCLHFVLRFIATVTDTNFLMFATLLYVNDFILMDKQLFIHTCSRYIGGVIVALISMPLLAQCLPRRTPPHDSRLVLNHSLYDCPNFQIKNSFPCINVFNAVMITTLGFNTSDPLQVTHGTTIISVVVLLTCLSCIYCGTHHASDTLAGYVAGIGGVLLIYFISE